MPGGKEAESQAEPFYVSWREACRLTNLSDNTLRALVRTGAVKVTRVGRRVLVPREALRHLRDTDLGAA